MVSIVLELIILSFTTVTNLILAALVFTKNPHKNINRYFAFFALSLVGWAITNYFSIYPVFVDQLAWIRFDMAWAAAMSMMLALLVNVFPVGTPYYKKLERPLILLGALVALLALSPWLFTGVSYDSGSAQPTPGPAIPVFILYVAGVLVLSINALLRRFRTLRGMAKEYIRYALIGIVLTFILLVIFNFILVLAFHNTTFILFSPVFSLIFSGSFAYGMIRYRLFDIRLVITRVIAYTLLLVVIGILYGFATVALSSIIVGAQSSTPQIIVSTTVVCILILFVQPLRVFLNRVTHALFYQDDYNTKEVLDKLASVLVRSTSTHTLANGSMTILRDALKSQFIVMMLLDGTTERARRSVSVGQSVPLLKDEELEKYLQSASDITVIDIMEDSSSRLQKKMRAANVGVVARLKTQSGVIAYCFFGDKTSGSAYGQRDIDLVRIASDELAVAIQNALSVEQIRDFNMTLQQRIEDATKELRETNAQLQRLDEVKDEFVSMASHQLRTPLTSVKGYISMVLEGDAGKISAVQRKLLNEAFTSSERMVHLISDFLNVSRLQTGKFTLERRSVDLSKVVAQEVSSLETTANARTLKLEYKAPSYFPKLYIDEGKIRQVLMNFIDNAIYYSEPNTTINVKLSVEASYVVLRVHNTGIGVPKEEQSHLFTKFFRATNARKQRPDGTGVGLFLAKKVVVAHGGTMVFESIENEGSTFGFRLPVKKLSAAPARNADKLNK